MWHFRIGNKVNDLVCFAQRHFNQTPVWMLIWMWIEQKPFPETPLCCPIGGNMDTDTAYLNSLFVLFGPGESVPQNAWVALTASNRKHDGTLVYPK